MREAPDTDPQNAAQRSSSPDRPLRDATSATRFARAPVAAGPHGSFRPFVNEELNSRLGLPAGKDQRPVRWSKPVQRDLYPHFVMTRDDRILVQGRSSWQLFDSAGESVALGRTASSDVVLDDAKPSFYMADQYGYLAAFSLQDGAIRFRASIAGVQTFFRQFIARRGSRFLIASWEQDLNTHGSVVPSNGVLEVRDFGDPVAVQEEFAGDVREIAREDFETPRLFAAAAGQTVVAATRDEVVFTDFDIGNKARFTGEFDTLALSLDDNARAYLLVRTNESVALWCVNKSGERCFAYIFPREAKITERPPTIDFNHRAYVHSTDTIFCIAPDGNLLWSRQPGASIAGIAATADDQLLVSAGRDLMAYDEQGVGRIVCTTGPDPIVTPPAMMRDGDLLVASRTTLYRILSVR